MTVRGDPVVHEHGHAEHGNAEHGHEAAAWAPAPGVERTAYTALVNVVTWIGFGLVLIAGLVLAGRPGTWREGLLWGLAGFAACMVAPGLGLAPKPPGVPSGPLADRQLWWLATVMATAGGLALLAFTRSLGGAVAAVALLCQNGPAKRNRSQRAKCERAAL